MSRCSLLLVLLVLPHLACDDGISSASRLRRLRLLAVQAEPPNPALGVTTILRPLVYVPPGESVSYAWSWCPVPTRSENGYLCPVEQAAVDATAAELGLTGVPPLDLGAAESIAFTNPFPPALLAKLCQGDSATVAAFVGGAGTDASPVWNCATSTLRMQVMLTITGSTTDTGVVSLRLPVDETTPGNTNPLMGGLAVTTPPQLLDAMGSVTVPRDVEVDLLAGVDATQAETYLDRQLGPDDEYLKDDAGQFVLGPTQERLTLSWYAEGGGFSERTTAWGPSDVDGDGRPLPFVVAIENKWTTPKLADYAAASSELIVVVRDNRGGVGWTRARAGFEGTP
jgi:hypothetical protein